MAHHSVLEALEEAAHKLYLDLAIIRQQAQFEKKDIIVSYDDEALIVTAPLSYKAFVPKKYKSFAIKFVEWSGKAPTGALLDLDKAITISKDEMHGIYVS